MSDGRRPLAALAALTWLLVAVVGGASAVEPSTPQRGTTRGVVPWFPLWYQNSSGTPFRALAARLAAAAEATSRARESRTWAG